MIDFMKDLQEQTEKTVRRIESTERDVMARALAVSEVLEEAFERLRAFVAEYRFRDEEEEILFFRELKPRMFCRLIYYREVYNLEMNRPLCGGEACRAYFRRELGAIQEYVDRRLDFYRYWRSGATHRWESLPGMPSRNSECDTPDRRTRRTPDGTKPVYPTNDNR